MYRFLTGALLILLPHLSFNKITIETSSASDPLTYTCEKVDFPEEQFVKCVCVQGLWAFYVSKIDRSSEWKIVGDSFGKLKCIQMGEWVTKIHQISNSSEEPKIFGLGTNSNKFAVANEGSWQINAGDKKYCFPGAIPRGYCAYELKEAESLKVYQYQRKCTKDSTVVKPGVCKAFDPSEYEVDEDESYGCSIFTGGRKREDLKLNRVKREDAAAAKSFNASMLDEDYISPEELANFMGEMPMLESISQYMLKKVIEMSGLQPPPQTRKKRSLPQDFIPPVTILRKLGSITKKICPAIKTDLFTLAQEVFLEHQRTVFHLREPYIAFAPYMRIQQALKICEEKTSKVNFIHNLTTPNETAVMCLQQSPFETSFHIISDEDLANRKTSKFESVKAIVDIPNYAASDPGVHEPIVELAWKMLVIPHNHCYRYFERYFNDHHTMTATLLPYFSNQIQNVWLLNGTEGLNSSWAGSNSEAMEYATNYTWYNNLLGNISRIYQVIDRCYGASKSLTDNDPDGVYYPWFLNRPSIDLTNQWTKRKKRGTETEHMIGGEKCQQSPIDLF